MTETMSTGTDVLESKKAPEQLHLLPLSEEECSVQKKRAATAAAVATVIRKRRYKKGPNPAQPMLLPPSVDDYVAADNAVRAIKAYVGSVDFKACKFKNAEGELKAGQPAFSPADLLGLYLYGYLNRVRSSRRLEAECTRNLEVIWLLNGLRPGYHTIADFRKDNPKALKKTNSDFIALCRELGLFGGALLGIDGSFFNGNASHASVKTKKQLEIELAAIERDIERYQQELDNNDAAEAPQPADVAPSATQLAALEARAQQQAEVPEPCETQASGSEPPVSRTEQDSRQACDSHDTTEASPSDAAVITENLDALKTQSEKKTKQIAQLEKTGETQLSRTDRDARRLTKHGKKVTGFNVQTVVDDEFKLILAHEVTNAGNDHGQLIPMIKKAKDVLAKGIAHAIGPQQTATPKEPLVILADAGYYTEADIAACITEQVIPFVPIPNTQRAVIKQGRLPGSSFCYNASQNVYICPAGQSLVPLGKPSRRNGVLRQRYQSHVASCKGCTLRAQCLPKKMTVRQIYRSEHAELLERHRQRMADSSTQMGQRASLCEHPFGTMKRWLGWDHFLVRGFKKVRGEMALLVNCYNLRRVVNILGVAAFIAACEARRLRRQAEGGNAGVFGLLRALLMHPYAPLKPFFRAGTLFLPPKYTTPITRPALAAAL